MTVLIPVNQWVWHLFKITYHETDADDCPAGLTKFCVSTDTHIQGEVCEGDHWPSPGYTFARWAPIKENVPAPRTVGRIYNHPITEGGWAAGERMASKLNRAA